MSLLQWFKREPDFAIGGKDQPYMLRWYVIPRNRWFNVYLHKILRDDDDRALHDHPWPSLSFVLKGVVRERFVQPIRDDEQADWSFMRILRAPNVVYRSANFRHRLELIDGEPCWTLFFTGPVIREWGFWCPKGFVHWRDFVDERDSGATGRGCGENV